MTINHDSTFCLALNLWASAENQLLKTNFSKPFFLKEGTWFAVSEISTFIQ